MAHNIAANNGAGSTQPDVVGVYEVSRNSRNVFHDLLDGTLGVSYIAPRPDSGKLPLIYRSKSAAYAAIALFVQKTSFTLTSTDYPEIGMTFAVDGSVDVEPHAEKGQYLVNVGYQELF